jgi:hypothetical protein
MSKRLSKLIYELRWRIHSFALGTTLALGTLMLGQGCAASGT